MSRLTKVNKQEIATMVEATDDGTSIRLTQFGGEAINHECFFSALQAFIDDFKDYPDEFHQIIERMEKPTYN